LAVVSRPRDCVNDVANAVLTSKSIIKLSQVFRSVRLATDLEELDTNLPRLCIALIEFPGCLHNDRFDVIAGNAICDDYDIEWLDRDVLALGSSLDRLLELC